MKQFFSLAIALTIAGISPAIAQQHHHHCEQCTPAYGGETHLTNWLAQRGLRFGSVNYRTIKGRQVIAVPLVSVVEDAGRYIILRRNDCGRGGLEPLEISLGIWDDHFVEVKRGVLPGELIVTKDLPTRDLHAYEELCMCANCTTQRGHEYRTDERTVTGRSHEYQSGYRDGYQAGASQSLQQKKPVHVHGEHGDCGSDCKGCSTSDHDHEEEIIFRKGDAKDASSGRFVPAK